MVDCKMYYRIHELKSMGYSDRRVAKELSIDRATVSKYCCMNEDEYIRYSFAAKTREKMLDRYRDEIERKIKEYPNIPASVVYDQFLEADASFAPSRRSVRLYVSGIREELGMPIPKNIRQYTEVAELPPGFQSQVDMGQQTMRDPYGERVKIYIFAMSMSHSRQKFVCFRPTPFSGDDFVMAHDAAFRFFGGRTDEIVYDQDRVMTVSENAGNIIYTEAFEAYMKYAGFSARLCRGSDPESKGKIESVVKFVKRNFLQYRTFFNISKLNSDGLLWLDRTGNGQRHETTKLVPSYVFREEILHLKPVPTISKPVPPREAIVRSTNVIHYRQNRYQVPRGTYRPGRKAAIVVNEGRIKFLDKEDGEVLAEHELAEGVTGKLIQLKTGPDRNRGTKNDAAKTKVKGLFDTVPGASGYIDQVIEKFPRYTKSQLSILAGLKDEYSDTEIVSAIEYCTNRGLYSADEFRATLVFLRGEKCEDTAPGECRLPEKYSSVHAQARPISEYSHAFGQEAAL
jgi:transposase